MPIGLMRSFVLGCTTVAASCSQESANSPSRTPEDLLRGRWKSVCLPFNSQEPAEIDLSDVRSHTSHISFNANDGWVYDEYFTDDKCADPFMRVLFAGTYRLGRIWSAGKDQAASIDFTFSAITTVFFSESAVQSANNATLCGGGHTLSSSKRTALGDCDLTNMAWGPRPFNIIRFEAEGLRPAAFTAERSGRTADLRPNTFDTSPLLVRQ